MNTKEYTVKKQDGSWWVLTPQGKRIVVPHKTRREAQQVANIFNHTQRDPATVNTFEDGVAANKSVQHRKGAGKTPCRYCGEKTCDYSCDESQAGGFNNQAKKTMRKASVEEFRAGIIPHDPLDDAPNPPVLDGSELATTLAALRMFQKQFDGKDAETIRASFPDHFEGIEPLSTDDIDTLCERLNSQEPAAKETTPTPKTFEDGVAQPSMKIRRTETRPAKLYDVVPANAGKDWCGVGEQVLMTYVPATKENAQSIADAFNKPSPVLKKTEYTLWSLYSEDEGVVLFDSERNAYDAKDAWLEAGANGVAGPFEHPAPASSTPASDPKPIPIIFVEGGIVQDVILPVPSGDKPYTDVDHDIVDYDIFEGTPDEEIAEYWKNRQPSTQKYVRTHCQHEYRRFRKAIDRHTRAQRKAKK